MKIIAKIFLLLFGLFTNTQNELGLGVVQVDIEQTKEIKIFKNKGDNNPEKVIRIAKIKDRIIIQENNYSKWLNPEELWLDYYQFLFRYTKIQDDWIEVIVNKKTGTKRWILNSPTFEVTLWDKFILEKTTAIEPLFPTDIKTEPNSKSKTIRKSSEKDSFEAIEISGDWIKIKTNEKFGSSEHPMPIKTGWIKWKEKNKLIIKYYLTC